MQQQAGMDQMDQAARNQHAQSLLLQQQGQQQSPQMQQGAHQQHPGQQQQQQQHPGQPPMHMQGQHPQQFMHGGMPGMPGVSDSMEPPSMENGAAGAMPGAQPDMNGRHPGVSPAEMPFPYPPNMMYHLMGHHMAGSGMYPMMNPLAAPPGAYGAAPNGQGAQGDPAHAAHANPLYQSYPFMQHGGMMANPYLLGQHDVGKNGQGGKNSAAAAATAAATAMNPWGAMMPGGAALAAGRPGAYPYGHAPHPGLAHGMGLGMGGFPMGMQQPPPAAAQGGASQQRNKRSAEDGDRKQRGNNVGNGNNSSRRKRSKNGSNSSQFRGVSWHKRDRRWIARGWVNSKTVNLGSYMWEKQAALAVDYKTLEVTPEAQRGDVLLNFSTVEERKQVLEQLLDKSFQLNLTHNRTRGVQADFQPFPVSPDYATFPVVDRITAPVDSIEVPKHLPQRPDMTQQPPHPMQAMGHFAPGHMPPYSHMHAMGMHAMGHGMGGYPNLGMGHPGHMPGALPPHMQDPSMMGQADD